jgi:hypothetical protein
VYLGDMGVDICLKKGPDGVALVSGEPNIKVYMQSRLPNPHYIPEVQAQTTLVNFAVAEKGLEDQLLNTVVGHERPDLLKEAKELSRCRSDQAEGAWRQPAVPPRDRRGRHPRQRGAHHHARGDQGRRRRDQREAGHCCQDV